MTTVGDIQQLCFAFFLNWLEYWSLTILFIEHFNKGNYYLASGYARPFGNSTRVTPHNMRRYGFADWDTACFLLRVPCTFVMAASGSLPGPRAGGSPDAFASDGTRSDGTKAPPEEAPSQNPR